MEETFPDPKEYLIGFSQCERINKFDTNIQRKKNFSTQRHTTSPTTPSAHHNKKPHSLLTKIVDAYDKNHNETKLNKSFKIKEIPSKKVQYDISKLYRKDILPVDPTKINFSNYLHFIQSLHKKEKGMTEEESKLQMKVKQPKQRKNPIYGKQQKMNVDDAILDYIKKGINSDHSANSKFS